MKDTQWKPWLGMKNWVSHEVSCRHVKQSWKTHVNDNCQGAKMEKIFFPRRRRRILSRNSQWFESHSKSLIWQFRPFWANAQVMSSITQKSKHETLLMIFKHCAKKDSTRMRRVQKWCNRLDRKDEWIVQPKSKWQERSIYNFAFAPRRGALTLLLRSVHVANSSHAHLDFPFLSKLTIGILLLFANI